MASDRIVGICDGLSESIRTVQNIAKAFRSEKLYAEACGVYEVEHALTQQLEGYLKIRNEEDAKGLGLKGK